MPVDHALLRSYETFEDPRLGIRERFLRPTSQGIRTVAVLGGPLGESRSTGWLSCASFGPEQDALMPLEVAMVRGMASAGFGTLRYHARGYGDSQDGYAPTPSAEDHVADAVAASQVLRESGVASVGLMGTRFGASIALLAAESAGADVLVLIAPVTDGRPYIRSLLVRARAAEMQGASPGGMASVDRDGVDVDGFPIPGSLVEAFEGIDVLAAAAGFRGSSIIVQVSRRAGPDREHVRLAEALGSSDGRCRVRSVVHPDAHRLGLPRFRKAIKGPPGASRPRQRAGKADVQAHLAEQIVESAVVWATELVDGTAKGAPHG